MSGEFLGIFSTFKIKDKWNIHYKVNNPCTSQFQIHNFIQYHIMCVASANVYNQRSMIYVVYVSSSVL